jgi:GTP cyclohydrolase IA
LSTPEEDFKYHLRQLILSFGDDPGRDGLLETPDRYLRAWKEWCSGYHDDPKKYFTEFELEGNYDEMVVFRTINFYSMCEHHLAPFYGTVSVAYIPGPAKAYSTVLPPPPQNISQPINFTILTAQRTVKVIGLSKVTRVVNVFARRLQVQERLVSQIADCLNDNLKPQGVGVLIKAKHLCMMSRGVRDSSSEIVTSALRGVMLEPGVKTEFFKLIGI